MSETLYLYPDNEDIEEVKIIWNENGYKMIEIELKNGENFSIESD